MTLLPREMQERLDALQALADAYRQFLGTIPGGLHNGTEKTPERAAKALNEMTSGYDVDVAELITMFDPDEYDGQVVVREVPFVSLCEHHVLPFEGEAHVVYLAGERVIGLSKIPRVVQAFARRLQQQERLTVQIADALVEHLNPKGVMVVIKATHSCMRCRGVRSNGEAITSALRGEYRDNAAARQEAEWLISL